MGDSLVDDSNAGHHVSFAGVLFRELADDGMAALDVGRIFVPVDRTNLAAVVKAVLRARNAVQVEPDLDAVLRRPGDRFVDVRCLSVDVWLARAHVVGPIWERQADMVQSGRSG